MRFSAIKLETGYHGRHKSQKFSRQISVRKARQELARSSFERGDEKRQNGVPGQEGDPQKTTLRNRSFVWVRDDDGRYSAAGEALTLISHSETHGRRPDGPTKRTPMKRASKTVSFA